MGFDLEAFTAFHVVLSLAGIASGLVLVAGWLAGRQFPRLTVVFLATTAATSLTGFGFPFHKILPSHIVGIISLAVLAGAVVVRRLPLPPGISALLFASNAMAALYLNVFVLIVQLFLKVPALHALAPTQTEMPFVLVQSIVFAVFGALSIVVAFKVRARHSDRRAAAGSSLSP